MVTGTTGFDAFFELVKERVDIVEFLNQYTTLTKKGNEWSGLCPLHNEKSGSFTVNEEKKVWHCFGCGKGGNIFTFLKEREGLDFKDAAQLISERYRIPLEISRQERQERSELTILRDIHTAALDYFRGNLLDPERGRPFQQYLRDRQFTRADADRFKLGAALDSFEDLTGHLKRLGFVPEQIRLSGLGSSSERNPGKVYDRFRGRLMIPICDALHRPIAFGGRHIPEAATMPVPEDGQKPAKYVNSPETPLFKKHLTLFALDLARGAIKERGHALVMEGYTDVMRAHQRGATHAIAAMGTALTAQQLDELRKYTDTVVLVLDSDAAGRQAAYKHSESLLHHRMKARVAILPGVKDPDEFLLAHSLEEFEQAIAEALPAPHFMVLQELNLIEDPQGIPGDSAAKREMVKVIAHIFRLIPGDQRDDFAEWVAGRIGLHVEKVVESAREEIRSRMQAQDPGPLRPRDHEVEPRPMEIALMRMMIFLPAVRQLALDHMHATDFSHPGYQRLFRLFAEGDLPLDHPAIEDLTLLQQFPEVHGIVTALMTRGGDEPSVEQFKRLLTTVRQEHVRDAMARVQGQMEEAQLSGDRVTSDFLMREQARLGRLLVALRNRQWPEDLPEFQGLLQPSSN